MVSVLSAFDCMSNQRVREILMGKSNYHHKRKVKKIVSFQITCDLSHKRDLKSHIFRVIRTYDRTCHGLQNDRYFQVGQMSFIFKCSLAKRGEVHHNFVTN